MNGSGEDKKAVTGDLMSLGRETLFEVKASGASWAFPAAGMFRAAMHLWKECAESMSRYRESTGKLTRPALADSFTDRLPHCYMLLAGLAVENLLKGLLLAKRKCVLANGKLPEQLNSHDLEDLFQRCQVPMTGDWVWTLTHLSKAVVWKGRYPVPLKATHLPQSRPGQEFALFFPSPEKIGELFVGILRDYPAEAFNEAILSAEDIEAVIKVALDGCPKLFAQDDSAD